MQAEWLRNGAQVVGLGLALSLYLAVVGLAVRVAVGGLVRVARGFGLTVGLGVVPSVLVVAGARALGLGVRPLVLAVLVAAVATLAAAGLRARTTTPGAVGVWLREQRPTAADGVAAAATLVVMAPLLADGLTYWTALVNDFPSYAASVEVWLNGGDGGTAWLQAHPDAWGSLQLRRSYTEKPMCTALLVVATVVMRTPPTQLLGPVTVVGLFVLVATMLVLVHRVARSPILTYGAVLATSLSLIPMSRAFDAQLGQVLAVAMLAVCVAVAAGEIAPGRELAAGAVAGVAAAATTGMNVTLVLGTGLSVVAVAVWLLVRSGARWPTILARLAVAGGVALALSLPFAGRYRGSLSTQTSGDLGYDIPLASPVSLLGLQEAIRSVPPTTQAAVEWLALLVVGTVLYVAAKRLRPGPPLAGALAAVATANGLVIVVAQGPESYAVHKWLAVAIPLVVPFLVVATATWFPARTRPASGAALAGIAAISLALSARAAAGVPVVVPDTIWGLADESCPPGVETLNVDTGSAYENSIVPLVVCSPRTVVTGASYAKPSPPVGNDLLVHTDQAAVWAPAPVTVLDEPYALVVTDRTLAAGTVVFGGDPAARRYLGDGWRESEPAGVWSDGTTATLLFDVGDDLRGRDLEVTLTGARAAAPVAPRDLVVRVDGVTVATATFDTALTPRDVTFHLPPTAVHDDRVVVTLVTDDPIQPIDYGGDDGRSLSYWLMALTVLPAAG